MPVTTAAAALERGRSSAAAGSLKIAAAGRRPTAAPSSWSENAAPAASALGKQTVAYPGGGRGLGLGAPTRLVAKRPPTGGVLRDISNTAASVAASGGLPPAPRDPTPPAPPPPAKPTLLATARGAAALRGGNVGSGAAAAARPSSLEAENARTVEEYLSDVWGVLSRKERAFVVRPDFLASHPDLNTKMRGILVNWLVQLHQRYRLRPETLFLTVNLVDRFLSRTTSPIRQGKLQLVGVVAFFVAAKFEEVDPPSAENLAYYTDDAYTVAEILAMECRLLTTLNFDVVVPTQAHILDSVSSVGGCDQACLDVTRYIVELGLLEVRMSCHEPSRQVAAALTLASELVGKRQAWPSAVATHLGSHFGHSQPSLKALSEEYRALVVAAPASSLQAIPKKHPRHKHLRLPLAPL